MRWFINSTKETAGISNMPEYQIQINAIRKAVDQLENDAKMAFVNWHDKLHDKGIQINNILKHQGNQDERIEKLENKLQYALHKIDDFLEIDRQRRSQLNEYKLRISASFDELEKRIKALENHSVPKQSIPDEKPKRERITNSYADEKFARHFEAAMHWKKHGMKHDAIAERMNHANFRTPRGLQYTERHVSDLLSNKTQCKRFLTHIVKRS